MGGSIIAYVKFYITPSQRTYGGFIYSEQWA